MSFRLLLLTAGLLASVDLRAAKPETPPPRPWSFAPLRRTEPPPVRQTAWPRTRIDRFLLARLEAEGAHPTRGLQEAMESVLAGCSCRRAPTEAKPRYFIPAAKGIGRSDKPRDPDVAAETVTQLVMQEVSGRAAPRCKPMPQTCPYRGTRCAMAATVVVWFF